MNSFTVCLHSKPILRIFEAQQTSLMHFSSFAKLIFIKKHFEACIVNITGYISQHLFFPLLFANVLLAIVNMYYYPLVCVHGHPCVFFCLVLEFKAQINQLIKSLLLCGQKQGTFEVMLKGKSPTPDQSGHLNNSYQTVTFNYVKSRES